MATVDSIDRYLGLDTNQFTTPMAQAILVFRATEDVKSRSAELADRANFGTLTEEERAEYLRYIELDELVTIIKSRARRFLSAGDSAGDNPAGDNPDAGQS